MARIRLKSFILMISLLLPGQVILSETPKTRVNELAWGEALYFHFKENKIQALTRLSARLEQGKLTENQTQAELLLAGILLDYGLPTEANLILENLTSLADSPVLEAKMYLANARVYFEQQQFGAAKTTLDRVDFDQLSDREQTQAGFMLAQIQFGLGNYAESADTLNQIRDRGNLYRYAQYNLGVSLLNVDDEASQNQAINVLTQVANGEVYDQEQYALADQSKLALGLYAINQQQYEQANTLLKSIRLDGLVSDEALLLLGWNALSQELIDEALGYWLNLASKTDILSPVVQEAWLAVPYAWQQKDERDKARKGYETALKIQVQAQNKLAELEQAAIWRDVLADNNSEAARISPAIYQQLVANPTFFELKDQWQELVELDQLLSNKARLVPVMDLAVKEQRERFLNKVIEARALLETIDLSSVEQQITDYQNELEHQLTKQIAPGLLNKTEASIWQRIERSQDTLGIVPPSEDMQQREEQLRRIEGIFYWEYHRQLPSKQHQANQSQQALVNAYSDLKEQHDQLQTIITEAKPPVAIDAEKLSGLASEIKQLQADIQLVKIALETEMALVYESFLTERKQALERLAEQAHLSLARLSFEAATKGLNDD